MIPLRITWNCIGRNVMRKLIVLGTLAGAVTVAMAQVVAQVAPAPNGIAFPEGYQDWRVISVSERTDNSTLRVIVGNDIAIVAARAGETNPWPDGAILGKIVLPQKAHEAWPTALVPDGLRHVEFMVKDSTLYSATGGWGFARWLGMDRTPFGENASFADACYACHVPVAENDYVFTEPITFP
jgi:hypothetical protein